LWRWATGESGHVVFAPSLQNGHTAKVVDIQATAEHAGADEAAHNLLDGSTATKWFAPVPRAELALRLSTDRTVVRYELDSANDAPDLRTVSTADRRQCRVAAPATGPFGRTCAVARELVQLGRPDDAWTVLQGVLPSWRPGSPLRVMPTVVITDPLLRAIVTAERRLTQRSPANPRDSCWSGRPTRSRTRSARRRSTFPLLHRCPVADGALLQSVEPQVRQSGGGDRAVLCVCEGRSVPSR
jgi:hypothetical protein